MSHEPAGDNTRAVAALVLGVASLPLLGWYPLSIAAAVAAIVSGYGARRSTSARMARIGMLCGSVALILAAAIIVLPD